MSAPCCAIKLATRSRPWRSHREHAISSMHRNLAGQVAERDGVAFHGHSASAAISACCCCPE
jgi:hypothetical protein